ncbi:MAG: lysine--tRNA ligase [Candidatus Dependentiae bacterium]
MKNKNETITPTLETLHETHVPEEHVIRVHKVQAMKELGLDPWPAAKEVNCTTNQIVKEFKEDQQSPDYTIVGRIITVRHHGKASFAVIQDSVGRVQIYLRQDDIGQEKYEQFKKFYDVGDIIWCSGHSFKTKMGEITLAVKQIELLSKCLYPLPEKFHGLTNIETIYRQRYLDLISSPESRERFYKRSALIRSLRRFLDNHGYMEVETPMLHPIPGGAAAKPFITHHNALDSDFYLRIAPELYLKRLVIGGFDRVYEINRNFRNEGISTRHNPEFTMLEFYTANKDYHWVMDFVEKMFQAVAKEVCNQTQVPFGDTLLDFDKPFRRVKLLDAVREYGNLSDADLAENAIDATLTKHKIVCANKCASWSEKVYALFEELVEHKLIQPTFVTHFPIEVSPLAKKDAEDPRFAARFELFIAGMEISNAFNELNDPFDQADRFKQQAKAHAGGDAEAMHYDAEFITALEYGLPPAVGVGIGIDRLAMLLTNSSSIKDVILFPTLKKLS